ncbi:MAG: htpX [Gammaproteobacteria bacterium]|jgi:heat shock protein HtpX|nr:htpX [Gammaproteobacteria bacterium]
MFKRVGLFLLTNLMVIMTVSIITNLLGLHGYLSAHGINYQALAIFCAIWGTAGAFISLLMSKWMAKTAMGVQLIDPQQAIGNERLLLQMVYQLASKAGLEKMPEVGIYDSPEVNAFATGPSRSDSLVAVSSGLLQNMDNAEIEGVLGHEISHIANGDMVTMTLIQGVVNAFSLFLSRVIAYAVSMAISRGDNERGDVSPMLYMGLTFLFDILFSFLGMLVVAAFSRYREYRADVGGAQLAGKANMIAALQRLQAVSESAPEDDRAPSLNALKISYQSSWLALLSTHPPLKERIQKLQAMQG